jgi:hypothetical protein
MPKFLWLSASAAAFGPWDTRPDKILHNAAKPPAVLHLARYEKAPRARSESGKLDVAFFGIVRSG